MWVAGVDGCKAGWFVVHWQDGKVFWDVARGGNDLLKVARDVDVLAIDIPIGLSPSGKRGCDAKARQLLGRRASSVFPAPPRGVLEATKYEKALKLCRAASGGTGMSRQTFGLLPKIREIDVIVRSDPTLGKKFYEVHPEVSFYFWNGEKPMSYSKKTPQGREERGRLVKGLFHSVIEELGAGGFGRGVGLDDVLDACAALWSARRIATGEAIGLPEEDEWDPCGLLMKIWA